MNNEKKRSSGISGDGLFIPNRQLSLATAGVFIILFCVFMGGYFVGKNHMLEDWMLRVENGSFADQVYTSLYARYEQDVPSLHKEVEQESTIVVQEQEEAVPLVQLAANGRLWYAPLVGYPSVKPAQTFAEKLQKKGIEVVVKKIPSTTADGSSKKYWYQVVTVAWTDRAALENLVERVSKEERLKNVGIKEVKL